MKKLLLFVWALSLPLIGGTVFAGDFSDDAKKIMEDYFNCDDPQNRGEGCELAETIQRAFEQGEWICPESHGAGARFSPRGFYQALKIAGEILCKLQVTCALKILADNILPLPVSWKQVEEAVYSAEKDVLYFGRWYYLPDILASLTLAYKSQVPDWPKPGRPPLPGFPPPVVKDPVAYLITASEDRETLRLYVLELAGVREALEEKARNFIEALAQEAERAGKPLNEDEVEALYEDYVSFRESRGLEPIRFAYLPFGIAEPSEDVLEEVRRRIVANIPGVLITLKTKDITFGSSWDNRMFLLFAPSGKGTEKWNKTVTECVVTTDPTMDPPTKPGRPPLGDSSFAGLEMFGRIPDFFTTVAEFASPFLGVLLDFTEKLDRQDREAARGFKRSSPGGGER